MRRSPYVALLVGVVLLSAGVLTAATSVAQQRQQDETLHRDAFQVASVFGSQFERARSLQLLLAESPAFQPASHGTIDRAAASAALKRLSALYPNAAGSVALLDSEGKELASVINGNMTQEQGRRVAVIDPAATLRLPPRQVLQAVPYVSPSINAWVISNSTPVSQPDGTVLVLHLEVALDSFSKYLVAQEPGHSVAVVDRKTGRMILKNDRPLPSTTPPGQFPHLPVTVGLGAGTDRHGIVEADGERLAVSGITRAPGNANDWLIVEWSTTRASFVPAWLGAGAAGVGVVLLIFFMLVLRRQQAALRMAAQLDHLTGLANRKALEEALDASVTAARSGSDQIAVLMFDLDGFKQINDTLGHDRGDVVLKEIGRRLHANTFEHDMAARLGGDEFAVVLQHIRDTEDVAAVAHRLREALVRPIDIDGVPRFIGASCGAAIYGSHGNTTAELLRAADAAMYQAKRGRDGVRIYDAGTVEGANASGLAAELLLAIENGQISLAFQPEFSLVTGRVVGIEALARWQRRGEADIPPSDFIPLAEETGLIRQLTHLTLRRALDEVRGWHDDAVYVPVSVNLSALLLTDRSIGTEIANMLSQRGLGGDALVLEITESSIVRDLAVATEVLETLRSIGVRVELDDFGSGYGSFKALQDLPLDGVKIDRTLVNDFSTGGQRLLAATIDVGRGLGLKVVAEGIEDSDALELVRRLGSDTAQGYLLARPMSPEALRVLLNAQAHEAAGSSAASRP